MVNSAGTVRETKALAKKFVRYKEGAELYSMGHSKFETIKLKKQRQPIRLMGLCWWIAKSLRNFRKI